MRTEQTIWHPEGGWQLQGSDALQERAQLVLVFGSSDLLAKPNVVEKIKSRYPNARIIGCSTAGEICGTRVRDDTLALTACAFEHTTLRCAEVALGDSVDSYAAGKRLALSLWHADLKHILVFSDGLTVNGSELAQGLADQLPAHVAVTGGLSGDGSRFAQTLVITDSGAASGKIAAVGLVSKRLQLGYGSMGGWDTFGPERIVTKSSGNQLYELDGCSALSLYNRYLGEHAAGLPATGLLFPLSIWNGEVSHPLVRTILGVNPAEESMTFAGDIPTGCHARLMRFTPQRLINGADGAAKACIEMTGNSDAQLALLISCVGRKLVLKQRVEQELEAVAEVLPRAALTGFYSYGEIAPFAGTNRAELHNQTMTITTLREI
jgi:hypothetical protein